MSNRSGLERPQQSRECCPIEDTIPDQELAIDRRILSAVDNDTRYKALRLIVEAEDGICGCQLKPALDVSQGAVSQALSRLSEAELVNRRKEGKWRYYTATAQAKELLDSLERIREYNDE